jgi:hypothetical protein
MHYCYYSSTVLNGAGTREFGLDLRLGAAAASGKPVWTEVLRGHTVRAHNTRIGIMEAGSDFGKTPKIKKAKYFQCVVGYFKLSIVKQRDVVYSYNRIFFMPSRKICINQPWLY